ncbi:Crp/Fnr family transcriptional regulator [Fusibacter ferrireducens]|uniref:Crp/Fnr family transcriptional regulator n=1 Tax=Fusibacter ferrireducens TaxID=2785058 RepID=A0ABR9ZM98_9FIRM|nr:Crp/Fnr family transcriptional regulator [Fusibacter ferrireducens]MBF4691577.1 Crp/Fnr family transcriptional regulator [Fusibacter ferrireducens]
MIELKALLGNCPKYIADQFITEEVEEGIVLMEQGSRARQVIFLIEGRVNIYRLALNGINMLEYEYGNYEMIGEVEALNGMEILSNVVTVRKCKIVRIDNELFREWINVDRAFNDYVLKQLADKLYEACLNTEINMAYPMKYKVLYYLLTQAKKGHKYIPKDELVAAIAGRLRSTNRVLSDLAEEDMIELDVGMIKIVDLAAIQNQMKAFENKS